MLACAIILSHLHSYSVDGGSVLLKKTPQGMKDALNPNQQQLDTSSGWKKFKTLHESIPKAKDLATLKSLRSKTDLLEPSIQKLFPHKHLASDLMTTLFNRIENRRELLRPIRGRLPRPDYWAETMNSYRGTQTLFRIIIEFKEFELSDSLITHFETQLPWSIESISESLKRAEGDTRERDGFPGEITTTKAPKMTRSEKATEIRAFIGEVTDSIALWKK
jgi:hypothetical protein